MRHAKIMAAVMAAVLTVSAFMPVCAMADVNVSDRMVGEGKLIEKTDCNAVVVDIKDGVLAWPAKTAKEWSPKSYKTAYTSLKKYRKGIDKLKETGVYMIGRIVVFNDPLYAKDHPEDCIKYGGHSTWPSAY